MKCAVLLKVLLITISLLYLEWDKVEQKPKLDKINVVFITQVGCDACEQIKDYIIKTNKTNGNVPSC